MLIEQNDGRKETRRSSSKLTRNHFDLQAHSMRQSVQNNRTGRSGRVSLTFRAVWKTFASLLSLHSEAEKKESRHDGNLNIH
eukprot:scaffold2459_cov225-Ochromonas_danica.AAC.4